MMKKVSVALTLSLVLAGCTSLVEEEDGVRDRARGKADGSDLIELKDIIWHHEGETRSEYLFRGSRTGGYLFTQGQRFAFSGYEILTPEDAPWLETNIEQDGLPFTLEEVTAVVTTLNDDNEVLTILFVLEGGCLLDPYSIAHVDTADCLFPVGTLRDDTLANTTWNRGADVALSTWHFGYAFSSEDTGGVMTVYSGGNRDVFRFGSYSIINPNPEWLAMLVDNSEVGVEAADVDTVIWLRSEDHALWGWMFRTTNSCIIDAGQAASEDCFERD